MRDRPPNNPSRGCKSARGIADKNRESGGMETNEAR